MARASSPPIPEFARARFLQRASPPGRKIPNAAISWLVEHVYRWFASRVAVWAGGRTPRTGRLAGWAVLLALVSLLGGSQLSQVGAPPRVVAGPLAAPDNSLVLQPFVTSGLSSPVLITHAGDGSNRLFVVEQGGMIKVVVNGQVQSTPFLDVTATVTASGSEQGLLGLAFHPQFKTNGRFFVFYTAKPPSPNPSGTVGNNVLAEYQVSPPTANQATSTPVRTLLDLTDLQTNHNGGNLAFGPDGYLYVGTGDEGGGGDPSENAQDVQAFYGKILRLDVDNGGNPLPPDFKYAIPPTNPYVGQSGKLPEIWALGLRNPWRWSFDRLTGDQLVGDVGQGAWEEIDVLPKGVGGLNLGWDDREGAHCYEPMSGCLTAGRTDPVLEYDHSLGCAVIGGYVYRGPTYPSLQGTYLYADECSGRVWRASVQGGRWVSTEALDTSLAPSSFGEDEAGEVYLVDLHGGVYRVTTTEPAATATPTVTPTLTPGTGATATPTLTLTSTLTPTATFTPTVTPTFTLTPTSTPTSTPTLPAPAAQPCDPRPRVVVQATPIGPGTLDVMVAASDGPALSNNSLSSLVFGTTDNALVTIGTQVGMRGGFTFPLPAGMREVHFIARRQQAGAAMRVDLTVNDQCGPWPTFVGAGVGLP